MALPGSAWEHAPSSGVSTPARRARPRSPVPESAAARLLPRQCSAHRLKRRVPLDGARRLPSCLLPHPAGSVSRRCASVVFSTCGHWRVGRVKIPVGWVPSLRPLARGARFGARPAPHSRPLSPGGCGSLDPPSNGARLPAELKHITKRRKRNQQGCP